MFGSNYAFIPQTFAVWMLIAWQGFVGKAELATQMLLKAIKCRVSLNFARIYLPPLTVTATQKQLKARRLIDIATTNFNYDFAMTFMSVTRSVLRRFMITSAAASTSIIWTGNSEIEREGRRGDERFWGLSHRHLLFLPRSLLSPSTSVLQSPIKRITLIKNNYQSLVVLLGQTSIKMKI